MSEAQETPVTVEQMDALVQAMFEQKAKVEAADEVTKALNKELSRMQMQAVAALKQLGRDNFKSPHGTVSIIERWRVSVPTDEEAKKELFKYFKEKEILYRYATVNSNSLNSYYNEEWEIAKAEGRGMEFQLPGVGEPKLFETCGMRKK